MIIRTQDRMSILNCDKNFKIEKCNDGNYVLYTGIGNYTDKIIGYYTNIEVAMKVLDDIQKHITMGCVEIFEVPQCEGTIHE